jgi:hypothetical protein
MSGRLSEPLLDTGWLGLVSPEIQKKKEMFTTIENVFYYIFQTL